MSVRSNSGRQPHREARPGSSRPRSPGSPGRAARSSPNSTGVDVLQRRCPRADDHDLVPEEARLERPVQHAGEGDRGDRSHGAVVVDQRSAGARRAGRRSAATTEKLLSRSSSYGTRRMFPPGSSSKFPLPTVVRAYSMPSAPPRKFGSPFSPTSVVAKTTFPARAGGVHEGVVLLRIGGRLAELDVVGDHLRAVLLQPRDHPSVIRARERPLQVQLVEGDVVDLPRRRDPQAATARRTWRNASIVSRSRSSKKLAVGDRQAGPTARKSATRRRRGWRSLRETLAERPPAVQGGR